MITFTDVTKRYPGGYQALKGVSLSLEPAEMVIVSGHGSSGRTGDPQANSP